MWKNKLFAALLGLLLVMPASPVGAQDSLVLKALIDKVLIENYSLRISRNQAAMAANNNSLGRAGFLPEVYVEGSQNISTYNTRQELFTGVVREGASARNTALNALVNVNWNIFDGFMMFAQRDKLGYLENLGAFETRYLIEQTVGDVVLAYYQLVRETAMLRNLEAQLHTSRFRYELERKRMDIGAGNALQLNQAQVDYFSDSSAFLEQRNLIRGLEIQINTFTQTNPAAPFMIADTGFNLVPLLPMDAAGARAREIHPELKMAQLEELISAADLRIQRAAYYPVIGLFGRYSYAYQTSEIGFAETSRSLGPQFGISIRMNLFNGGVTRMDTRNALKQLENASLSEDRTLYLLLADLELLYSRHASYGHQLGLALQNLEAANRSFSIARTQWEQGRIDGYEFRLTQLAQVNAGHQVIRLQHILKTIEVEIDLRTGGLAERYL